MKSPDAPLWIVPYTNMRADAYVLLGALLGQPPSENILQILQTLQWEETLPEGIDAALRALRRASFDYGLPALKEEFERLFVGVGSGEIVPYASWYRERRMQSLSLANLRSDLMRLGIVRQTGSHESEDHAGVLCETMALISQTWKRVPIKAQAAFFQQHIAPWMMTFFRDLQTAKSARFYQVVGLLGTQFLECESEYLKYSADAQAAIMGGGGLQDED